MSHADPVYVRMADDLRAEIRSGRLLPGDKVPSERELCELYGVSRVVPVWAMRMLVTEGYVVRVQGKGSYVALPTVGGFIAPHCPTCTCGDKPGLKGGR